MTSEILKLKNNSAYIEDKVACVRQFNARIGQLVAYGFSKNFEKEPI